MSLKVAFAPTFEDRCSMSKQGNKRNARKKGFIQTGGVGQIQNPDGRALQMSTR